MYGTTLPNFLTETECTQLIELARPRLQPSYDHNITTGIRTISNWRTSQQVFIPKYETILIRTIEERVAQETGFPLENQEPIQVVHYLPGQYYKVHWDPVDPSWPPEVVDKVLARGGNRVMTFMLYLNTIPEGYGGETWFDKLGLTIRPDIGKGLMWYNLFADSGTLDKSVTHEARAPIHPYEKWIATIWIREREYID